MEQFRPDPRPGSWQHRLAAWLKGFLPRKGRCHVCGDTCEGTTCSRCWWEGAW